MPPVDPGQLVQVQFPDTLMHTLKQIFARLEVVDGRTTHVEHDALAGRQQESIRPELLPADRVAFAARAALPELER